MERDRLSKVPDMAHSTIKALETELDNLQVSYERGSRR
jgi:cell division control protein 12